MHRTADSLYYTPESNMTLCVPYTGMKKVKSTSDSPPWSFANKAVNTAVSQAPLSGIFRASYRPRIPKAHQVINAGWQELLPFGFTLMDFNRDVLFPETWASDWATPQQCVGWWDDTITVTTARCPQARTGMCTECRHPMCPWKARLLDGSIVAILRHGDSDSPDLDVQTKSDTGWQRHS